MRCLMVLEAWWLPVWHYWLLFRRDWFTWRFFLGLLNLSRSTHLGFALFMRTCGFDLLMESVLTHGSLNSSPTGEENSPSSDQIPYLPQVSYRDTGVRFKPKCVPIRGDH